MSRKKLTYNEYEQYFGNNMPGDQKHAFEKQMMQDSFDEEAFDGLSELSAEELTNDISELKRNINRQTKKNIPFIRSTAFKIAASVALLIGTTGLFLLTRNQLPNEGAYDMALSEEETQTEALVKEEAEVIIDSVAESSKTEGNTGTVSPPVLAQRTEEIKEVVSEPVISSSKMERKSSHQIVPEIAVNQRSEESSDLVRSKALLKVESNAPKKNNDKIKGIVTDSEGKPLRGVNVYVSGTMIGDTTELDGSFILADVSAQQMVNVDHIGYEAKKVEVNPGDYVTVNLAELDEIPSEAMAYKFDNSNKQLNEAGLQQYSGSGKSKKMTTYSEAFSAEKTSTDSEEVEITEDGETIENKELKDWIITYIDYSKLKQYKGAYAIIVNFKKNEDDVLSDFTFENSPSPEFDNEIKKAVQNFKGEIQAENKNGNSFQFNIEIIITVD